MPCGVAVAEVTSRVYDGTIVRRADDRLVVNVRGSELAAAFLTGYVPIVGDSVRVLVSDGQAVVLGAVLPFAPPASGEVVSASGGRATLSTDAGTVTARYMGTAPTPLSVVRLDWSSTTPWIAGVIQSAPAPSPSDPTRPPAPRPPSQTGTLSLPASVSGSWRPTLGQWQAGELRQSAYGGGQPYMGSWLYPQAQLKSLSGRTITRVRLRLGARLRIGSFNGSMIARFHPRLDANPNGAPAIDAGIVHDHGIGPSAGPHWIDLPIAFGERLRSGGGLVLAGPTYGGFAGINADPESGQLQISWRR